MPSQISWNARVEHDCLFVDDLASGKVILQHNARPGTRPYIHPLRIGRDAVCLTEDSPWHHPWQHGIQTCFVGVNGCDFWTYPGVKSGQVLGTVECGQVRLASGPVPRWVVEALWRHADGSQVFADRQTWRLSPGATGPDGPHEMTLDLDWTLRALTNVVIERHNYGGLFVRMPFRYATGATVVNSSGLQDDATEQQPATWVDVSMPIERGQGGPVEAGIAVCDHAANPGHPTRWRVDAQRGVNPSPCIAGAIDVEAGEALRLRYRMILHQGSLSKARIEELAAVFDQEEA